MVARALELLQTHCWLHYLHINSMYGVCTVDREAPYYYHMMRTRSWQAAKTPKAFQSLAGGCILIDADCFATMSFHGTRVLYTHKKIYQRRKDIRGSGMDFVWAETYLPG